jgi:hypothetical protein
VPVPPNSKHAHGPSGPVGKKSPSGGGLFGAEGRFFKKIGKSAEGVSTGLAQGMFETGKAVVHDTAKASAMVPGSSKQAKKLGRGDWETPTIGKAIAKQTYTDVRHPLRDPFSTALTLGALLAPGIGTGVRGVAAVRAVKAAKDVSVAEKAALAFRAAKAKPLYIRKYNPNVEPGKKVTLAAPVKGGSVEQGRLFSPPVAEGGGKITREVAKSVKRELTPKEAQKRLDVLDKLYEDAVKKIEPIVGADFSGTVPTGLGAKSSERSLKQAIQTGRNIRAGKTGVKVPTVNAEIRAKAEDRLLSLADKHPDQPFAKLIRERERLKAVVREKLPGEEPKLPSKTERVVKSEVIGSTPFGFTAYGSRNPLLRGLRKVTLEPAYKASRARAVAGKSGGGYARSRVGRELEQRKRFEKQLAGVHAEAVKPGKLKSIVAAPTNVMRMGMFTRPRYVVQNVLGTGVQLGMQQGPGGLARSAAWYKHFKEFHPAQLKKAVNAMGGTGTASIAQEAVGPLSGILHKTANVASAPESRMRPLALFKAARDERMTPQQLADLLDNPKSNIELFHRIVRKANDEVTDYSRIGKHERKFMQSQIPIFYPMTKGFSRYAGKFPGEHPVQAGLYGALGRQGKKKQEEKLGQLPSWAQYLTAVGGSKKHPVTIDPTLISPFQPGTDVGREIAQSLNLLATGKQPIAGMTLLRHLGPTPQLAFEHIAGLQIPTGYPSREEPLSGFGKTLGPIPLVQALLNNPQALKSFEKSSKLNAFGEYLGGRTFAPRTLRPDEIRKQVKRESHRRQLFVPPFAEKEKPHHRKKHLKPMF